MVIFALVMLAVADGGSGAVCPSEPQTLEELGVRGGGWAATCRAAGDGLLLAAVRAPGPDSSEVEVATAIVLPTAPHVRAVRFVLRGPEDKEIRQVAEFAENWQISIALAPSELRSLVRLGVFGSGGEDLFVGQEIVTFLWAAGGTLVPAWTGLGSRIDRRFDCCLIESTANFRRLSDDRLERVITTKRTFRNAGVDRTLADSLRKECTSAPPKRETFTMTKAPAK